MAANGRRVPLLLSVFKRISLDLMDLILCISVAVTQSEQDKSCILLVRLQKRNGEWLHVHCVLQVKENMENTQQPVIVCTNQVLSAHEAPVMQANSWLYHYYMVQSKLQYGGLQAAAAAAAVAATATAAAYDGNTSTVPGSTPSQPINDRASTTTTPIHYHHSYHSLPHEPIAFESTGDRYHHHHHHHHHHPNDNNLHQYDHQQHVQYNHNGNNQPQHRHRSSNNTTDEHHIGSHGYGENSLPEPVDYSLQQHGTDDISRRGEDCSPLTSVHHIHHVRQQHLLHNRYEVDGDVEPVDPEDDRDSPPPDEVIVDLDRSSTTVAVHSRIYQTTTGTATAVQLTAIKMNHRPHLKSIATCDPATEFMEQWNPSPPWSDTLQKVPDIVHHDLSPYVTTTPPTPSGHASVTPTSASTSSQNVGAFTFDWIPEQYVPNVQSPPPAPLPPVSTTPVIHHDHDDRRRRPVENTSPVTDVKDEWRRRQVGHAFQLGPPPPPRCHVINSAVQQTPAPLTASSNDDDVEQSMNCRSSSTPTSMDNSSPANACVNMC